MAHPATTLTPEERLLGLATAWSEVKYNYPMWHRLPDLDWDKSFRERIATVLTDQPDVEYYDRLAEFCALVCDSHVRAAPPEQLAAHRSSPPVQLVGFDGKVVVAGYAEGLAADCPISLGDAVESVDGLPISNYLRTTVRPGIAAATPQFAELRTASLALAGVQGTPVDVEFTRPDGAVYACRLQREPADEDANWIRYEPLHQTHDVEGRHIEPGVGYIKVGSFMNEQAPDQFGKLLASLEPLRQLIVDVRTNTGGNSTYGDAIISMLIDREVRELPERRAFYSATLRSWGEGKDGTGIRWEEVEGDAILPHPDIVPFTGRLTALISRMTHSAAENFVGTLIGCDRATLVGEPTAGSTGNPLRFPLPGGGTLIVCTRYETLADWTEFIGVGIAPHVHAKYSVEDIAAGRDPVLQAALSLQEE
jgi:C-terminal processing protease CtpA/Prc